MAESYETTISMLRSRIAELEAQNEYIRKRDQQLDLLIGKNAWLCRLQSPNGRPLAMLKTAGVDL
jgi:hypothetical protein